MAGTERHGYERVKDDGIHRVSEERKNAYNVCGGIPGDISRCHGEVTTMINFGNKTTMLLFTDSQNIAPVLILHMITTSNIDTF